MNVNLYIIEDYENETAFRPKKTNPTQTQFKPNLPDAQMSVYPILTKDYERNDIFAVP